jgi:hypothetical protein
MLYDRRDTRTFSNAHHTREVRILKVTTITCDNCGETIDPKSKWERIEPLSQDWCYDCRAGVTIDLTQLEPRLWPKRVTRETLMTVVRDRDYQIETLKSNLNAARAQIKGMDRDLQRVRHKAADAYATSNRPAEDLKDIATNARRS